MIMTRKRGYIVPTDWLAANPPKDGWHAETISEVPERSLLAVEWIHVAYEREFEANLEVAPLGDAWEIPSTEVLLLLTSAPSSATATASAAGIGTPTINPPVVEETLANALRRLDWPMARELF